VAENGGGINWLGILGFIGVIVLLNVLSYALDWNMTFY